MQQLQNSSQASSCVGKIGVNVAEFEIQIQMDTHQVRDSKELYLFSGEVTHRARFGNGPDPHHGRPQLIRLVRGPPARHKDPHRSLRLVGGAGIVDPSSVRKHELHNASGIVHLSGISPPGCHGIYWARRQELLQLPSFQQVFGNIYLVESFLLRLVWHRDKQLNDLLLSDAERNPFASMLLIYLRWRAHNDGSHRRRRGKTVVADEAQHPLGCRMDLLHCH
mmetsp:Transcript_23575/g.54772  ORF Transcript_23575/g.54772 Transcript_23575/m.54772 type:complete len:222 (+) Transcript_23575:1298-1963(+)